MLNSSSLLIAQHCCAQAFFLSIKGILDPVVDAHIMFLRPDSHSLLPTLLILQASSVLSFSYGNLQQNASVRTTWDSNCKDYIIPVEVQRSNSTIPLTEQYDINVLYALAGKKILASNSYNLSARKCFPSSQNSSSSPSNTIQLLLHGATFSKIMWDFPYQPETYSWTKMMNEAGYSTIAVDLVGE